MKFIFYFIIFHLPLIAIGQTTDSVKVDPVSFDYSKIDSIALSFPKSFKYKTIEELAHALTVGIKTEHEKFRVLFRWVADNIEYSWGSTSTDPKQIAKKKKAVCAGYSSLLQSLCNYSGIEVTTINGYAKSLAEHIRDNPINTKHAWNAVKLYNKWYLVDVTWAAGSYDMTKKKFYKEYDNFWFLLTDNNFFALSHFPYKRKWQLLKPHYVKWKFRKTPLYTMNYKNAGINWMNFPKGKIKNRLRVKFVISTEFKSSNLTFYSGEELGNQYNVNCTRRGKYKYIIKYNFKKDKSFDTKDKGSCALSFNGKYLWVFWKE
jgi:hypothetical protein